MESNTASAKLSVPHQSDIPDPRDQIHFSNGMFHVPTQSFKATVIPPASNCSPATANSLAFAFDPDATCPTWQLFLMDVLGRDTAALQLLREWFGYCMTRDTRMGRLMVILGDPHSILAVILSVLTEMIPSNQSGRAKLRDMGSEHFVRSFQSKFHYTIENESLSLSSSREVGALANTAMGKLVYTASKCQRKIPWSDIPTRLTMLTPPLASVPSYIRKAIDGALVIEGRSRNMDGNVARQLMQELPGIANWSIASLRSLRERGFFLPSVKRIAVVQNSATAYASEQCDVVESAEICGHDLLHGYKMWAEQRKYRTMGMVEFLTNIASVSPLVSTTPKLAKYGRSRNIVHGLQLKK